MNIKNKNNNSIKIIDVKSRNYTSKLAFQNLKYSLANSIKFSKYLLNNLTSNHALPKNIKINSTYLDTNLFIYGVANALSYYKSNKKLPSSISYSTIELLINLNQLKKGVNEKTTLSASIKKLYLKTGKKCTITSSIKNLATKLTKNCKTNLEKAYKIFKWVHNNIEYSYYYNSLNGASKTLKKKKGNCCDNANLIVALTRASGIPARYVHSTAKFYVSGNTYGHVWAQVYADGYWICLDTSCEANEFGCVNAWNVKTFRLHGIYKLLPF